MSRIGKKEIQIPEGVSVDFNGQVVSVSGPKGSLLFHLLPGVEVKKVDQKIMVKADGTKETQALHGTVRQRLSNMIKGVDEGWSQMLEVMGTGYRVNLADKKLVFSLGFSHKVEVEPPEGITFQVAENKVTISGVDKVLVGKVAAETRQLKVPDSYKGKGIRYLGERIKLKPGKATKAGGTGK